MKTSRNERVNQVTSVFTPLPPHRRLDEGRATLSHGRIILAPWVAIRALLAVRASFKIALVQQVCFDARSAR